MRLFLRFARIAAPFVALACAACSKDAAKEPAAAQAGSASAAASAARACKLLEGTWRVDGFAAAGAAPSPSAVVVAEQLTAAMDDRARAIRIAYTGTRVKSWSPGSMVISNAYEIKEGSDARCTIDVRGERNVIEVVDADHVLVDRAAAGVGARMRLARTSEAAPEVGPK